LTLNLTSTVTQQYRDLWKTCSKQCGVAVLLKRMVERKLTKIEPAPTPALPALR
jgi:hypothetical protein